MPSCRIEKSCEKCKKYFYVVISNEHRLFCSKSCAGKIRVGKKNGFWSGGKIKTTCNKCKKEFYVNYAQIKNNRRKYCSFECRLGEKPHNFKGGYLDKDGYKQIYINKKSLREHRVIMEKHLNNKLLETEVIHHINGVKDDNRIENLEVMTNSEHSSLHARLRKLER